MKFPKLYGLLIGVLLVGVGYGQTATYCPDGNCGQVQLVLSSEVAAVEAILPYVRCIMGNSCGSGTICGADAGGAYVLTNAHVAGTRLGVSVAVDLVTSSPRTRVLGKTVFTGYSSTRMVDFAIVYVEGLSCRQYMPMLKTEPNQTGPYGTTGSPRCVWPLVVKEFNDARSYGDGLMTGTPNAIGGQSGSAIYNKFKQQVGLLTWSINGRCAAQKTYKLWQVANERDVQLADIRPDGLKEIVFGDRAETEEGVFGELPLLADCAETQEGFFGAMPAKLSEVAFGQRAPTEDVVQNIAGSAMEEMPIWVEDDDGQTDPTDPVDPNPDCMVVTPKERELIEFIRTQETGIRERAIDWISLLRLIMEIIALIQEGRATS